MTNLQRTSGDRFAGGDKPLIVAAIHSPETLALATGLADASSAEAPDLLELRVDHFAMAPEPLARLALRPPRPLLVTVRRADEGGGKPDLRDPDRAKLYEQFLALSSVVGIDVEIRSREALAPIISAAQRQGKWWVASFHDFEGMPSLESLRSLADQAVRAGADVFKVAATTRSPDDLATLLRLLAEEKRLPLALMGMGSLGKVSRLALAAGGSVLNYGHLGAAAQVPGQWPAALLRARLQELG